MKGKIDRLAHVNNELVRIRRKLNIYTSDIISWSKQINNSADDYEVEMMEQSRDHTLEKVKQLEKIQSDLMDKKEELEKEIDRFIYGMDV